MKLVRGQLARGVGNAGQSRAGRGAREHLRTSGHLLSQAGGLTKNPWFHNRSITRLSFKTNCRNSLRTKFAITMLVEKPVEKQPLAINVDEQALATPICRRP